MRLDKLLSEIGAATRSESARAARGGRIEVNGVVVRDSSFHVDPQNDTVKLDGVLVHYREYNYIMLNKPEGYVSATEDGRAPFVIELLPTEMRRLGLFPCGRLDKNTTGLMLLTDNGALAHRLLAPKSHVEKKYRFGCREPLSDEYKAILERGVTLADGYETCPCEIELDAGRVSGIITLHEGKYHQIKRMFGAAGDNRITQLERVAFASLKLDRTLARGEWRYLTDDEIAELESF